MCGIVAIVRRPSRRPPPPAAEVLAGLEAVAAADPASLDATAEALEASARLLNGVPGLLALIAEPALAAAVDGRAAAVDRSVAELEAALDSGSLRPDAAGLEALNASLVRVKDALWAIRRDRLGHARAVAELAGPAAGPAALAGYSSVQSALSALDRLEVRGRDSAGIHVLVDGHELDLDEPEVAALLRSRAADRLFGSMAVRCPAGRLAFVYKAAAEVGELGDNVRHLRAAVAGDGLLRRALSAPGARAVVLGHTRWASVGIISQANAHPVNAEEVGADGSHPYVVAAVNGDVDNYAQIVASAGLRIAPEVTTDSKVVPVLVSRAMAGGRGPADAFLDAVAGLEGSVAVAASIGDEPDRLVLALRGSGQALNIGLAEDAFVVASEAYGLVEHTARYVRMDGEATTDGGRPGQVVVLDGAQAGELAGIERRGYDGRPLPVVDAEVQTAEITTRDIDRRGLPHFLLKEIAEAPSSFRKTLRGKLVEADGLVGVRLADGTLPPDVRRRLAAGTIRRVVAVGQGTAAVAAESLAAVYARVAPGSALVVDARLATELSGFGLHDDMADTLVVAVSQSGTTTDTNRTVDLVRSRGAAVVAIVNRRNSELAARADGVLYTSDGRDIEMAVPSTKAFYAQVAAGALLAVALAEEAGDGDRRRASELLVGLRELPAAMEAVLAGRDAIAAAAQQVGPPRRHWAVVGSGPNRIAAAELRIKLSELCYKSIACDATEDKKHIDLSSEPMVLVCAAGLSGPNADDVAKEVAIYRAHKAAPVVIASQADSRFSAALHVIEVPACHPALAFVLSAMAGHLFGYEAALAIDAQARPLREARAAIEAVASSADVAGDPLRSLRRHVEAPAREFLTGLQSGAYDGHLEAATAVRLTELLRYARGVAPLESYELELGKIGSPSALLQDLTDALTRAIDELTRPIDAIKHQAKTVTVGISRSEEALFRAPLVEEVLAAGAGRDRLGYRALRTLAALGPAVAEVTGFTRYRIDGDAGEGPATIAVVDRGGVALTLPSRTERQPALLGTKHRAASEREVTVARGRRDGRELVLVPETKDSQVTGMTLLHVRFHERLAPADARAVLAGYRDRFEALVDAVTETEPGFDEEVLGTVPMVELLSSPVHLLADHWRSR
ncbi:MAG TPA: SIS domain-containing protein [Acidimicrobiales bacterium]|nr:SIS domain-containing protein [Acidimicrobiales bacterium]